MFRYKLIKSVGILLIILLISLITLFYLPKPPLLSGISFSRAVYTEEHHLLRMTLSKDEKFRLFTPLSQMPQHLIEASLLQEDRYFRQHVGVNPFSLIKAIWQTYGLHSRRVGASTITMQLARIRFGFNSKTIQGKLLQIIKALQLEMHYSKNQILEAYLNLAPYGGNVEGVGAASLVYFNKSVSQLSLPESLTLSIIPQNPSKRTPRNNHLKIIRDNLFTRWLNEHPEDINKKVLFALPLLMQDIAALPFKVAHLVNTVLADSSVHQLNIETSLNGRLQGVIERIVHHYIARKKSLAVNNAAVLLVDTRDMRVKALVGSADFFNKDISGQINGVEIKRSPGSTLKPFIYGLAMDQGLIHPNTVLKDVPRSFNGYNPENFDYDFMGPIKAKDALVLSRNIPAIFLSNQLTHPSLHQFLEQAHISRLKSESYYGLSLNLGGAELTLNELVGLYAMLVNDGLWYPIQFLKTGIKQNGERLLSPEASYLVLDMLKSTPGFKSSAQFPVSWKTGTSSGFRDAWTLGTFGPYVLGVWIGNFDNKSNPAFVGKDIAAPLFFELIDAIRQEDHSIPVLAKDPGHMNLKKIKVCKASGMLPRDVCHDTEWTWFIPGKSPIHKDTIHREVAINNNTGLRTCHINESTRFEIFEFWPTDLLTIFKKAGIQRHSPPFFEPDCVLSSNNGLSPQITSPQKGLQYVLQVGLDINNMIPLSAVTDAGIEHLYWFLNDGFLGKTKTDEPLLWRAKPGQYVVRVVDDHGMADSVSIHIKAEG
ncbi:MAG: penicillin-binding protein 1C [Legionella sp.]|nr:penicillin-binding protein 1C [Legionella sp.]